MRVDIAIIAPAVIIMGVTITGATIMAATRIITGRIVAAGPMRRPIDIATRKAFR